MKFVFFGLIGNRQLDGSWQEALEQAKLQDNMAARKLEQTVISTITPSNILNTRYSYTLYVTGRVSDKDVPAFIASLTRVWQNIKSGKIFF